VPLEDDSARGDVDLLDDAVEDEAVPRPADRVQVLRDLPVDRDERRAARGDEELMLVAGKSVPGVHLADAIVRAVEDLVLPAADSLRRGTLPPREHGPVAVALHAKVGRAWSHRVEPDDLAVVVGDQRPRLRDVLLRREEEIAGRGVADAPRPLEDGGLQVGAAVEVLVRRQSLVLAAGSAADEESSGRPDREGRPSEDRR
jgi:hypothetical protein